MTINWCKISYRAIRVTYQYNWFSYNRESSRPKESQIRLYKWSECNSNLSHSIPVWNYTGIYLALGLSSLRNSTCWKICWINLNRVCVAIKRLLIKYLGNDLSPNFSARCFSTCIWFSSQNICLQQFITKICTPFHRKQILKIQNTEHNPSTRCYMEVNTDSIRFQWTTKYRVVSVLRYHFNHFSIYLFFLFPSCLSLFNSNWCGSFDAR